MNRSQSQLSPWVIRHCALRSFLLQASWNFDRLQGLGALFVLAPALRSLYQGEERKQAFRRHMGYFNTHPYLASAILGSTIALEESAARGEEQAEVSAVDFNAMMMAPFAAIGDALFWGGLRPIAAVLALFFAARGSYLGCVVLLSVFNFPHLFFRFWGFSGGWRQGAKIVETIQRWHLPDLAIRLKEASVILLGGVCASWVASLLLQRNISPGLGLLVLPLIMLAGLLVRKGVSPLLLIYTGVVLIVVTRSLL